MTGPVANIADETMRISACCSAERPGDYVLLRAGEAKQARALLGALPVLRSATVPALSGRQWSFRNGSRCASLRESAAEATESGDVAGALSMDCRATPLRQQTVWIPSTRTPVRRWHTYCLW